MRGFHVISGVDGVTRVQHLAQSRPSLGNTSGPFSCPSFPPSPYSTMPFHADSGSEHINHRVAELLDHLQIGECTKESRPRERNDDALVESRSGSIGPRWLGHILSAIVHSGHPGGIEWVMVGGRPVMRVRTVLTVDEDAITREADVVGRRVRRPGDGGWPGRGTASRRTTLGPGALGRTRDPGAEVPTPSPGSAHSVSHVAAGSRSVVESNSGEDWTGPVGGRPSRAGGRGEPGIRESASAWGPLPKPLFAGTHRVGTCAWTGRSGTRLVRTDSFPLRSRRLRLFRRGRF